MAQDIDRCTCFGLKWDAAYKAASHLRVVRGTQTKALTVWNSNMTEHRLPDASSENPTPEFLEDEEKISEYADEMTIKFITGKKPISEYPDFTAQLENMGIRSIIQSKQKAYDDYLLR